MLKTLCAIKRKARVAEGKTSYALSWRVKAKVSVDGLVLTREAFFGLDIIILVCGVP